jgi:aspartate ammonia-lyase
MHISESLVGNAQAGGFLQFKQSEAERFWQPVNSAEQLLLRKVKADISVDVGRFSGGSGTSIPMASAAVVANYYHRISTISTHSNRYSVGTRPYVTQ